MLHIAASNLLALVLGQVPVPSTVLPPTTEQVVVFTDEGRTYTVGLESKKVFRAGVGPAPNPNPIPDVDPPTPDPEPAKITYKYACIVISATDTKRQAWKDSVAIRDAIKANDAVVTFLRDDERDIELRNLRKLVTEKGSPLLVLWDEKSKVVLSRNVQTEAELLEVLK